MSLQSGRSGLGEIPAETARVARAAFRTGNLVMRIRDTLGPVFTDEQFADLFPSRGKPAYSPARLALVSVLQFVEGLSDRGAANQVRSRIDWKYALGLALDDAGFDHSLLSEFRDRLIQGGAEQRVLDAVVDAASQAGLLTARGRARTDATHVLAGIREVNRLELVGETLRAALEQVAEHAPGWLASWIDPAWIDRYGTRIENYRLPRKPGERAAWARQVGADGQRLLTMLGSADAPPGLTELEQVRVLRRVWDQEFTVTGDEVVLRDPKARPAAAARLVSPYDLDARTGSKRDTVWDGYKVHLTETCDPQAPRLVTHVVTTPATVTDNAVLAGIHAGLAQRERLPGQHLVDAGYVTAREVVAARRDHGVEVVGPVLANTSWQAQTTAAFTLADFHLDYQARRAVCPAGRTSTSWGVETQPDGGRVHRIEFSQATCRGCPVAPRCTQAKIPRRRLSVQDHDEHEFLQRARLEQVTPEWQERYQARAGVEGTLSAGVRAHGLRRSRYRGLSKTNLQHNLTGAAINLVRISDWQAGKRPAKTRTSHLKTLDLPTAA